MNARFLGLALGDVIDAADWYDSQSPGLGDQFSAAVDATVAGLVQQPRRGWRPAGAPRGREVRETLVTGFPYRLVYELTTQEIIVLSVFDGRGRRRPWRGRV